jgi:hypothetical protein
MHIALLEEASVIKIIKATDFLSGFCSFLNLYPQMMFFVLFNVHTIDELKYQNESLITHTHTHTQREGERYL